MLDVQRHLVSSRNCDFSSFWFVSILDLVSFLALFVLQHACDEENGEGGWGDNKNGKARGFVVVAFSVLIFSSPALHF